MLCCECVASLIRPASCERVHVFLVHCWRGPATYLFDIVLCWSLSGAFSVSGRVGEGHVGVPAFPGLGILTAGSLQARLDDP